MKILCFKSQEKEAITSFFKSANKVIMQHEIGVLFRPWRLLCFKHAFEPVYLFIAINEIVIFDLVPAMIYRWALARNLRRKGITDFEFVKLKKAISEVAESEPGAAFHLV